jgi:hypothetical protein
LNKLLLIVLCLSCCAVSVAQEAAESRTPPGVSVVGLKWSKKMTAPGKFETQPFDASRSDTSGTLPDQSAPSRTSPPSPFPSSPLARGGRPPYFYAYSLTIRDEGDKHIKAIQWEHIFLDPNSGKELARHTFTSHEKKGGGGAATFRADSFNAPSNVVSAPGLAADERSPFKERGEIKCALYEDGTFWENPASSGTGCEDLRRWLERKQKRRI